MSLGSLARRDRGHISGRPPLGWLRSRALMSHRYVPGARSPCGLHEWYRASSTKRTDRSHGRSNAKAVTRRSHCKHGQSNDRPPTGRRRSFQRTPARAGAAGKLPRRLQRIASAGERLSIRVLISIGAGWARRRAPELGPGAKRSVDRNRSGHDHRNRAAGDRRVKKFSLPLSALIARALGSFTPTSGHRCGMSRRPSPRFRIK
jgi:hypothetical protein